jgi:hypothetical protein
MVSRYTAIQHQAPDQRQTDCDTKKGGMLLLVLRSHRLARARSNRPMGESGSKRKLHRASQKINLLPNKEIRNSEKVTL